MMTEQEVAELVGIPYLENGSTPEAGFNCWGLLRYVEARWFGIQMPEVNLADEAECLQLFVDKTRAGDWTPVETPQDGDGVLLRGGTAPHVGVYLFGGVLHSQEGIGVIFTRVSELKYHGYGRVVYYRLQKNEPNNSN